LKYVGEFGGYGDAMNRLKNPTGLGFYDNLLYIADKTNQRVIVYR